MLKRQFLGHAWQTQMERSVDPQIYCIIYHGCAMSFPTSTCFRYIRSCLYTGCILLYILLYFSFSSQIIILLVHSLIGIPMQELIQQKNISWESWAGGPNKFGDSRLKFSTLWSWYPKQIPFESQLVVFEVIGVPPSSLDGFFRGKSDQNGWFFWGGKPSGKLHMFHQGAAFLAPAASRRWKWGPNMGLSWIQLGPGP